jgi:putative protein-disulfide isomerase
MPSLIYIADPMCSWCYGFGPELLTLLKGLPEMPIDIVVGGLRANNTEVMDEKLKSTLLTHWKQVEEATGLPFSYDALSKENFIYNTEPACRAVVTAKRVAPQAVLHVFFSIQNAFYAQGLDVTQGEVLAKISAEAATTAGVPLTAEEFLAAWNDEVSIAETNAEFEQTRTWQVSGFPTLVLERNGQLDLISSGFMRTPELVEQMQTLVDQAAQLDG